MKIRSTTTLLTLGLALAIAGCSGTNENQSGTKASSTQSQVDQGSSGSVSENAAPIVSQISNGTYTISSTFDGPDNSGLVGLVLEPQGGGSKQIGWASADGRFVTPGPLFNAQGEDLSAMAMTEHGGVLSASDLADRIMENSLGFVAGKSGPVMSVFFEPYCGYCNRLFEELKPRIDSGEIRVRFLMVPFLRPDSAARGAEIAFAKDPYKALTEWEERSDKMEAEEATASSDQQSEIQSYGVLFNEANLGGTPASLMCDKGTGQLEVIRGFPQNMGQIVANMSEEGHSICQG